MTTEANKLCQQILTGLRQGADGEENMMFLLQSILRNVQLAPEDQTLLELLGSLQANEENSDGQVIDSDYEDVDSGHENLINRRRATNQSKIEQLQEELADLREVNDTMAASVGACQYCWGGDDKCVICEGYGAPGWREPDPRLFDELIVPAILRLKTLRHEFKQNPRLSGRRRARFVPLRENSY